MDFNMKLLLKNSISAVAATKNDKEVRMYASSVLQLASFVCSNENNSVRETEFWLLGILFILFNKIIKIVCLE